MTDKYDPAHQFPLPAGAPCPDGGTYITIWSGTQEDFTASFPDAAGEWLQLWRAWLTAAQTGPSRARFEFEAPPSSLLGNRDIGVLGRPGPAVGPTDTLLSAFPCFCSPTLKPPAA
jgi:hypothetical protein